MKHLQKWRSEDWNNRKRRRYSAQIFVKERGASFSSSFHCWGCQGLPHASAEPTLKCCFRVCFTSSLKSRPNNPDKTQVLSSLNLCRATESNARGKNTWRIHPAQKESHSASWNPPASKGTLQITQSLSSLCSSEMQLWASHPTPTWETWISDHCHADSVTATESNKKQGKHTANDSTEKCLKRSKVCPHTINFKHSTPQKSDTTQAPCTWIALPQIVPRKRLLTYLYCF